MRFIEISELKKDYQMAEKCKMQAELLRTNIKNNAWDGEWYKRAYFDDGTPLGSKINEECRIDSIVQSWSVLSKLGDSERAKTALSSAEKFLVRKDASMIQLFEPPFDKSELNPGYIKGYVPGIRENGGQYTHAAIWLIMAFAAIKDRDKTWKLLHMINPINHGDTEKNIATYRVEPYVMAADIYADPLHLGRGGWTWYTGSAGWMYQLIIESFLGITKKGNTLRIDPCLPDSWNSFTINYQYQDSTYDITILKNKKNMATEVFTDDQTEPQDFILLQNDGKRHIVRVNLGNIDDNKL
jgi:cellobiose phosphorylase